MYATCILFQLSFYFAYHRWWLGLESPFFPQKQWYLVGLRYSETNSYYYSKCDYNYQFPSLRFTDKLCNILNFWVLTSDFINIGISLCPSLSLLLPSPSVSVSLSLSVISSPKHLCYSRFRTDSGDSIGEEYREIQQKAFFKRLRRISSLETG